VTISAAEQYLIELINRARLDPISEAERYGIELNQGLAAGTLDGSSKQPLAGNEFLAAAAQAHSEWMLDTDTFSHTGEGGSVITERIQSSGYELTGSWGDGENLAYSSTTGTIILENEIEGHHRSLFLSAGHRPNTLNGNFREIGVAQVEGEFTSTQTFNSSMLTEKFAYSGTLVFITGVFYSDTDNDDFYSIGEGTTGQITLSGATTVSSAAGGYAVAVVPAASVTINIGTPVQSGSLIVDTSAGNAKIDLVNGTEIFTSVNTEILSGFQHATLLGLNDLRLSGSSEDNTLTGNSGNNTLSGVGGTDILYGNEGADQLFGGAGSDTLYGGADNDTLSGGFLQDILYGDGGDDVLNGDEGLDTLFGGSGNDTLFGGGDQDALFGGAGADLMDGGDGSDVHFVDTLDTVQDSGTFGFDRAQINDAAGVALNSLAAWSGIERVNGFTGNDTLDATGATQAYFLFGNDGNDSLIGGNGADTILGGNGADVIFGGDGNDILQGGTGNDTFYGGAGNDLIYVGESDDVVADAGTGFDRVLINNAAGLSIQVGAWQGVERIVGFTGNDTIDATGATTGMIFGLGAGNDVAIGGSGNDTVYAGAGNDLMLGGAGDDALIGGNGNDTLNGGAGNDFLLGGVGADVFVFATGFGNDVIRDFTDGIDMIDFRAHTGIGSLSDLVIQQSGVNTIITLAATGPDQITLTNADAINLTAEDFIFA
jgi:Ca2+-binding RTX toxin-like protein